MNSNRASVVFDCMVYSQAMISRAGPSAECVARIRSGDLHLVWSDYVLQEVRELPAKLPARLRLTPGRVEAFIADVAPFAQHIAEIAELYTNPFDADDSHYVNLVLAGGANLALVAHLAIRIHPDDSARATLNGRSCGELLPQR